MTDAEIKKALECCYYNGKDCTNCPCTDTDCTQIESYALDLINRQQAEVERLQKELALKGLEYTLLERDRAKDICDFAEELQTIKAEAIKEFAEKVDEILKRYAHLHKYAEKALRERMQNE